MARRYFNWKLVIVLLIGLVVLSTTAFGLRQWQKNRRSEQGLVLGNKAYEEHRWEEAAKQLGRHLGVMQNDVPALLRYAEAQLNIRPLKPNNLQQAIGAYRNVLRVDQGNLKAANQLSEMYLNMGMPAEAELIATKALDAGESKELRKTLAIALASQRKFTQATQQLKSVIEKNPGEISAYEVLGWLAEQRPESFSEDANSWFDEAIKKNSSSAEAYIARGAYFLRHADKVEALVDLERAQEMDLNNLDVRLRLAEQLINADAPDLAEKQLEIIQTSQPDNQFLWQLWAQIAIKSDANDFVLKIADTGLKELSAQPWDFMPYATELFIKCGQYERAKECITTMRTKDIAPDTTAFLNGLWAEKQGFDREAVKSWSSAIQLGAKSPRVRLSLAKALWRLGDRQSAINQLRILVSEQPDFIEGRMVLAQLLADTGQLTEAAEQTRNIIQLTPGNFSADLQDVRVKLQLLANSRINKDSSQYRDLAARLDILDKTSGGALDVKLVRFRLALQRADLIEAENLITDLKKKYPAEIRIALAEADILVAQEKTDDAIAKLREVISVSPQSVMALRYLVSLLAAKEKYQDCEAMIKNALASAEQPAVKRELNLLLADVYGRSKERGKRYSLLNSLSEQMQDDIPVQRELLTCGDVLKEAGRAQQVVDRIKSIEGENGWQWRYEQARIWFVQEDFKNYYPKIVSFLQENLLANPDDQASRMLLAATYEKGDDQRLAISTYVEAVSRSPKDVGVIVPAVAAFYRGGEYDRAEEILKQTVKEGIYHPELQRLEAQSSLRRGDLDSSNEVLEKMFARDPNDHSVALSLALLKIRQDKFAEAQELLEKLRAEEPNSLPVAAALVDMDIRMDKPDDAIRVCDEMVAKLHTVSASLFRGRTFVVLRQPDKARADFENAVKIEPNNVDAWVAKSVFHRSIGESNEAVAVIRNALSAIPGNLQLQKTAVSLYLASNDRDLYKEGEKILEETLTSNPGDIDLRLQKARLLLAKRTAQGTEQASDILRSITEKQPEIGNAWVLLAQIALQEGKPAKAMDVALRGLVHRPNDRTLLLLKAKAEGARSPELALPTLKALWELDPNNPDSIVSLAEGYMAAGQYENAVNLLTGQMVSAGDSQQRKLNLTLAVALYKNGNKTESEEIFRGLSGSEPNDPRPLLAQIRLLRDDKLWDKLRQKVDAWSDEYPDGMSSAVFVADELVASKDSESIKMAENLLRRVLKHNPDSPVLMVRLASLLYNTNRSMDAVPLYKRAIELQPDNLIAINNLAWILCEDQKRPQEAIELVQQGLTQMPDYVDLLDTRGVAHYRLGQFDLAMQDFKKCISLYPNYAPAIVASYFHLGRTLSNLGEKVQAIEQLNKALELNMTLGGLADADLAEANRLLKQLSGGGN